MGDKGENMKPTEEQIKELWDKLDVKLEHDWTNDVHGYKIADCICDRCGKSDWPPPSVNKCYPPIDLNNLFKWTREKLQELELQSITFSWRRNGECEATLWFYSGIRINGLGRKEEEALFWVIWKVIKEIE